MSPDSLKIKPVELRVYPLKSPRLKRRSGADTSNTQRGNTMLKNIAIGIGLMFLMAGSAWIGDNGWTIWLGIPLVITYIITIVYAIREYKREL